MKAVRDLAELVEQCAVAVLGTQADDLPGLASLHSHLQEIRELTSTPDFREKSVSAGAGKAEKLLESLVKCGACDDFGPNRAELAAHTRVPARLVTWTTTSPCKGSTTALEPGMGPVAKRSWVWVIAAWTWFDALVTSERCTRFTSATPVKASTTAMASTKNNVNRARMDS